MGSLPKTKKSNIPKSIHEMSKEMLRETLKKKKECNSKALWTVEKLCEAQIDEDWLLTNLQFINQCHFDDVIIERAILKICGYPLCDQELHKIPAQQYHISTRYNKVFDITERKNFCSSNCYKSAMHVKKQLFTTPLWLRDKEVIPEFTVLKSSKSLIGEVVFFPDKIRVEPENIEKTDSRHKNTLNENIITLEEKCSNLNIFNSEIESHNKTKTNVFENVKSYDKNIDNNLSGKINAAEQVKPDNKAIQRNKAMHTNIQKIIEENPRDKNELEKTKTKIINKPSDIIKKVEKSVFEWFSLDTTFYLYEEEKLKELFQDKFIKIKELLNTKLSVPDSNKKINKMIQLYELLDIDSFNSSKNKLNPLPDYSSLKEEGKNLDIKVRAFYQGNLEISMPTEVKVEHDESKISSNLIYLPLIDAHAQIAHRKKIVLDQLNKMLPGLMKVFSSDFFLKMSEVRGLITTFSLAAHNITFKPAEWYLIGIIIIKLLCLRDKQLDSIMKLESSKRQMLLILKSFELQKDYLDNLLLRLTVNDNLLKN